MGETVSQIAPMWAWIVILLLCCVIAYLIYRPHLLVKELQKTKDTITDKEKTISQLSQEVAELTTRCEQQNIWLGALVKLKQVFDAAIKDHSITDLLKATKTYRIWNKKSSVQQMEDHIDEMQKEYRLSKRSEDKIHNLTSAAEASMELFIHAPEFDDNTLKDAHQKLLETALLTIDEINDYNTPLRLEDEYYSRLIKKRDGQITNEEFLNSLNTIDPTGNNDRWVMRMNRLLQTLDLPHGQLIVNGYKFYTTDKSAHE